MSGATTLPARPSHDHHPYPPTGVRALPAPPPFRRPAPTRQARDEAGLGHIPIMAYAAKQASAFYGPFREAAESAPQFGDRRGYQMDPRNAREALREIEADLAEGADHVVGQPA